MKPSDILHPSQRRASKAYLVNKLREAVYSWREGKYDGATDTSKTLLNFWFNEDHLINNEPFEFWFAQREAIETLIYVYEVLKKRNFIDLAREFGSGPIYSYDPIYDQYPLYAFKMATGSGKTFVMAFAIVWSYFNHQNENPEDYTSRFLLIAPNVIVYDRLKKDFGYNRIFKEYPFIPPEWRDGFDLKVILREDPIHLIPEKVLFLTNIQQLESTRSAKEEAGEYVNEVLALEDVKKQEIYQPNRIREILDKCPNIMILKDEAHHIYNFEKAWKKILVNLHKNLCASHKKGIHSELDFSATPKQESGAYFPWIVVDFSLAEAIGMNIVKRPIKGKVKGAEEIASKKVSERYRAWIDVGIKRWREYKKQLERLGKNPILFIMCEDTESADEVFEYLVKKSDFRNKTLLIHTNLQGDVIQRDLDEARIVARLIDTPEAPEIKKRFPQGLNAIVSVMMLNEGWDVRNVNVIVGLRSYTSKRKVLPEQVIGRGLRKMFPEEPANIEQGINALEVIGPPGLTDIIDEFAKQEGFEIPEFDVDKKLNITTIFVDEDKMDKDIKIPILSPLILIREFSLDDFDFEALPAMGIKLEDKTLEVEYSGLDMLTGVEVIKDKWILPGPKNSKSVIVYYTYQILKLLKIPGAFADFYPLVKKYVSEKLFEQPVDLDDPRVLYKLNSPEVQKKLTDLFVEKFRDLTFKEREPELGDFIMLSNTAPFVWSKAVYPADKCIFNYVACDNEFEVSFAKFLDSAEDVLAFTKLVYKIGFSVEYRDSQGFLRSYLPDFLALTKSGEHLIFETKGLEDVEVKLKDARIKKWCEDAQSLTGQPWKFFRINQSEFEKYTFKSVKDLITLF